MAEKSDKNQEASKNIQKLWWVILPSNRRFLEVYMYCIPKKIKKLSLCSWIPPVPGNPTSPFWGMEKKDIFETHRHDQLISIGSDHDLKKSKIVTISQISDRQQPNWKQTNTLDHIRKTQENHNLEFSKSRKSVKPPALGRKQNQRHRNVFHHPGFRM